MPINIEATERAIAAAMASIHEVPLDDDDIDLLIIGLQCRQERCIYQESYQECDELIERLKEAKGGGYEAGA